MKVFLIDPENKTVTEESYNGDYKEIYKFIGVDLFTIVRIDDKNMVFIDDEGLLKDPGFFFSIDGYPQPLAGRGLVAGVDEEGETVASTLTLRQVKSMVKFLRLRVEGFITETEENAEIMPGMTGTKIKNQVVFSPRIEDD